MPRPKEFDPQQTLTQALLLFWEKGYEATSVDDLVARLSLNRSSLYNTFGGKHELFMLALKQYSARVVENVTQTIERSPSTAAAFRVLCGEIVNAKPPQCEWGCLMVNSIAELLPQDQAVAAVAQSYIDAVVGLTAASLRRDQIAGRLSAHQNADQLALTLFTAMQGLRLMSKTHISRTALLQVAESVVGLIT